MHSTGVILSSILALDIFNLKSEMKDVLFYYLMEYDKHTVSFNAGEVYETFDSETSRMRKFTFSHDLIRRTYNGVTYFDIVGPNISTVDFYTRRKLLGIIKLRFTDLKVQSLDKTVVISTVQLDPRHLKEEESIFLGDIVEHCAEITKIQTFFAAGVNKIIKEDLNTGENCIIYLDLACSMVYRKCSDDPMGHRYEIVGKMIGSGEFSKGYLSQATLSPQANNALKIKRNEKSDPEHIRVVRIAHLEVVPLYDAATQDRRRHTAGEVAKTYALERKLDYLNAKPPTISLDEKTSYSVSKYLPDMGLDTLIGELRAKNLANEEYITLENRLLLTREILDAADKIHYQDIVHRDLKDSNVRIHKKAGFKAFAIDLGLSKLTTFAGRENMCGSPLYFSPEKWARKTTTIASDVAELTPSLCCLWNAKSLGNTVHDYQQAVTAASSRKYINLCENIPDLHPVHKDRIIAMFYAMSLESVKDRMTFRQAKMIIEKILLELKFGLPANSLSSINTSLYAALENAHKQANAIKAELEAEKPQAFHVLHDQIIAMFDKEKLKDSPVIIKEFVWVLNFNCLLGLQTRLELETKIKDIIAEYEKIFLNLKSVQLRVNNILLDIKRNELKLDKELDENIKIARVRIEHALAKCSERFLTLDDLPRLSKKLNKAYNLIQPTVDELNRQYNSIPKQNRGPHPDVPRFAP